MEIPFLTTGCDDEILRCVLEKTDFAEVQLRQLSQRWMAVWRLFPAPVRFAPPGGPVELELEVNQAMSKLIFTCNLRLHGGTTTVARMDWTPSYFGARKAHAQCPMRVVS
ncbi:unnamed protein product [Durusdinium trenchii]|uniref:Uncharacterized protein n=1 Tax=Durusdinium trenchii TaxID=1381693 RepID=A0ABP0QP42_9DINO